jgi:propionyl-CoA carboxylase alpha chain
VVAKLLIANRGEIAVRIARTARRLGIATVAVFTEADAGALHPGSCDEAVALGGDPRAYLDAAALVAAARATGADAVHPGYGFLAENADFARAVQDAGLTWVGPPPEAIEAMGSKVAARERMAAAGVPVLDVGDDGPFPVIVKASAGGGGKGMRVVQRAEDLPAAREAAAREAQAAFGDGAVFVERYLTGARHVEVQLFGDQHGTVVALHERECSIQRRHQKLIEECPSPAVDAERRGRLADAAVAAGEAIGYVGAGTVEFLLTDEEEFFFLEVNTRLQVEHPVTELVTGLDLVELQLRVAEGEPLPAEARRPRLEGWAIEARLCAEDPANGFLPQTGRLGRLRLDAPGVRVDTGFGDGSDVSVHYDPMLAKVIAHGPTRTAAARALAAALAGAQIAGVTTNRDLLVRVLRDPDFLAGRTHTGFLEGRDLAAPLLDDAGRRVAAAAAVLAGQAARRAADRVLGHVPSGFRTVGRDPQRVVLDDGLEVAYRFARDGTLQHLAVDGQELAGARLHAAAADEVDLEVDGVRRRLAVHAAGAERYVFTPQGTARFVEQPRHPLPGSQLAAGSLTSPMPGTVVRVAVAEGEQVAAGTVLLALEAMKMEHEVLAPADGTVRVLHVEPGAQVQTGAVLVELEAA